MGFYCNLIVKLSNIHVANMCRPGFGARKKNPTKPLKSGSSCAGLITGAAGVEPAFRTNVFTIFSHLKFYAIPSLERGAVGTATQTLCHSLH